jgi:hypothetical protein
MKFRAQSVDLLQMYDKFPKTDTFRTLFSRAGLQFVIRPVSNASAWFFQRRFFAAA